MASDASNPDSGRATPSQVVPTGDAEDVLKAQSVGLVQLADFKKRRADALDQTASGASTPQDGYVEMLLLAASTEGWFRAS